MSSKGSPSHTDFTLTVSGPPDRALVRIEGQGQPAEAECDLSACLKQAKELLKQFGSGRDASPADPNALHEFALNAGRELAIALGEPLKRLEPYWEQPDTRIWIRADDELQKLPFEALRLGQIPGATSRPRPVECGTWQVLRVRSADQPTARESADPVALGLVVIVVGDCRRDKAEDADPWPDVCETVERSLSRVPEGMERKLLVARVQYKQGTSFWIRHGAQHFGSVQELEGKLLGKPGDAGSGAATALLWIGHADDEAQSRKEASPKKGEDDGGSRPALLQGSTALRLDRSATEPQYAYLPVDRTTANGRKTLAQILPANTRLLCFLGCETGERFAAEFPNVEHVIGIRTKVPFALFPTLAESLLKPLCRVGTGTVGEAVRCARSAIVNLASAKDTDGTLSSHWWTLAHWPLGQRDEPFLDATGQALSLYRRALKAKLQRLEGQNATLALSLANIAIDLAVTDSASEGDGLAPGAERRTRRGTLFEDPAHRLNAPRHYSNLREVVFENPQQDRRSWTLISGATVLKGWAGSGKTTVARDLARQLAEGSMGIVPLFVSLADWSRKDRELDPASVLAYAFIWAGAAGVMSEAQKHASVAALHQHLNQHGQRWVLIFDGVDECGNRTAEARQMLDGLARQLPQAALLVTTRPEDYTPIRDRAFRELWLEPLDEDRMVELLHRRYLLSPRTGLETNWSGASRELALAHVTGLLQTGGSLLELARTPLFLGLMADPLLKSDSLGVTRRDQFLQTVTEQLLKGLHREHARPLVFGDAKDLRSIDITPARRILRAIAKRWSTLRVTQESRRDLVDWLNPEFEGDGAPALAPWTSPIEFLATAQQNGLFHPVDPDDLDGPWRFRHRQFQELLMAEWLHDAFKRAKSPLDELLKLANRLLEAASQTSQAKADAPKDEANRDPEDSDPSSDLSPLAFLREPFALLAGLLGKDHGSHWIRHLLEQEPTRDVGLSAVATAEGLNPGVMPLALTAAVSERQCQLLYPALASRLGQGRDHLQAMQTHGLALASRLREVKRRPKDIRELSIPLWFLLDTLDQLEQRHGARRPASLMPGQVAATILDGFPPTADLKKLFTTCPNHPDETWLHAVPHGEFRMGSPLDEKDRQNDEGPVQVQLHGFQIARTAITQAQYAAFDAARYENPSRSSHPATIITWYDAALFCIWLHHHGREVGLWRGSGLCLRLPTEAEWEYAIRGAPGQDVQSSGYAPFLVGDSEADSEKVAHFRRNTSSDSRVQPVGGKEAFGGLYDGLGNVWEWTGSWYGPLRGGPDRGGPMAGTQRVLRGGSAWFDAWFCRAACRDHGNPDYGSYNDGFRVVLAPRPVSVPR
jgi:formylglycine-generating enzyme required for sulfatase activity